MSKLVPFGGNGALANPAALATALQNVSRETASSAAFLRMGKDGIWIIGVEMEPVEEGTEFAVNPAGFGHGWIAWGKSERLGENFVPLTEPMPEPPVLSAALPSDSRGWEQQFGMHLREVATQTDLIYRSSSVGGKRAIGALAKEVGARMAAGEPCVPVVTLLSDSYIHGSYGKIYVPEFVIERWVATADAPATPVKAAKVAPVKAPARAPGRRPASTRRR